jgi:hypothetical protein
MGEKTKNKRRKEKEVRERKLAAFGEFLMHL